MSWPRLDYVADKGTIETLHLLLQMVGKLPLRLHPWINHGWHLALRMTPRGAVTRSLPAEARQFAVELDFLGGAIRIECDSGSQAELPVAGKTIAEVHVELTDLLASLGLPAPLHGAPNETPDPVPFAEDDRPREWNADAAARLHGAFLCADRGFNAFRSLYRGKASPSHLFWGSFDLAVTRFSGREAPIHPGGIPNLPDAVTREAYSHEEISAGFWPGGEGFEEAAFYAYAYPTPAALAEQRIAPDAAFWQPDLREFMLPYAKVREAADPGAELQRFLDSTFEAAASLLDWPSGLIVDRTPSFGRPPVRGLVP
jgi:hypothetical protein